MPEINVLSLFDGISVGRLALDRAGYKVNNYYTSEVDKYAIQVSNNNYPDIIRLGDVTKWREWSIDWSSIDLLIGGSPCQGFSFSGKQLAFNDPRSKLFFEFVDILNHIRKFNPEVKFLLENVRMKNEFIQVISNHLEVEPVLINSSLVSAQNRERLYWANWNITQPEDKRILLKDIIIDGSNLIKQTPRGKNKGNFFENKSPTLTANSFEHNNFICSQGWHDFIGIKRIANVNPSGKGQNGEVCSIFGKSPALTTNKGEGAKIGLILAGTANDIKGHDYNKRIYSIYGKSPCLTSASGGNLEPKIAVDELVYRKLTPLECERLQTVPDGYTAGISNSQRYKCLGNGWTADVIAHIFRCLKDQKQPFINKYEVQLELAI